MAGAVKKRPLRRTAFVGGDRLQECRSGSAEPVSSRLAIGPRFAALHDRMFTSEVYDD